MRALTVRQPWAWAIIGGKSPENRTRNIAGGYRGPLAIHAAKAYDDDWSGAAHMIEEITGEAIPPFDCGHGSEMLGAFIGVVDLVDVHWSGQECLRAAVTCHEYDLCSPWAMAYHHHLVLANPRPLEVPIPARGMLGLWTPEADVLEQLQAVAP